MGRKINQDPEKKIATRGQRLWAQMLEYRHSSKLSLARAKLLTASYKETEGYPPPLRRAKAFGKIVAEIPIYIEKDDLLVGAFAARPMDYEWYPEYAVDQEMASKQLEGLLAQGHTEEEVREIIGYFKDRCLQACFLAGLDEKKKNHNGKL